GDEEEDDGEKKGGACASCRTRTGNAGQRRAQRARGIRDGSRCFDRTRFIRKKRRPAASAREHAKAADGAHSGGGRESRKNGNGAGRGHFCGAGEIEFAARRYLSAL